MRLDNPSYVGVPRNQPKSGLGIFIIDTEANQHLASWAGAMAYIDEAKTRLALMRKQDWWNFDLGDSFDEWVENLTDNTTPIVSNNRFRDIIHEAVFEHGSLRVRVAVQHNIDRKGVKA